MRHDAITTERLSFRLPDATDLAPYTAYCGSDRSSFAGGPFGPVQAFEKLAAMIGHWALRGYGRLVFADRVTGRALGHVGALHLDPDEAPELTWTIWAGADEGKGHATEACTAYLAHARDSLRFPAMIARIAAGNAPSRRLALRIGGIPDPSAPAPARFPTAVRYDFALQGPGRPGSARSSGPIPPGA